MNAIEIKRPHFHTAAKIELDLFKPYGITPNFNMNYNHLTGGNTGYILSTFLKQEGSVTSDRIKQNITVAFNQLITDSHFTKKGLTWLTPEADDNQIFRGNIGIYLGLSILDKMCVNCSTLKPFISAINLIDDYSQIKNGKLRKKMQNIIDNRFLCTPEDLDEIYDVLISRPQIVLLEFFVVILLLGENQLDLINSTRLYNSFKVLKIKDEAFLSTLIRFIRQKEGTPQPLFDLNINFTKRLVELKLNNLFSFSALSFDQLIVSNPLLEHSLNLKQWLTAFENIYKPSNLLFKNLLKTEIIKASLIDIVLRDNYDLEQNQNDLHRLFLSNWDHLFEYQLSFSVARFKYIFSNFWLGSLKSLDFGQLNTSEKIDEFARNHRNRKLTLLIPKRYGKKISWQARSFKYNEEVDFIYFFLKEYKTLNEYKKQFSKSAISDFEMLELIFWGLEVGILNVK